MSSELQISYQQQDGLYTGSIKTSHDGFTGGVVVKSIVISSLSNEHYYNNIKLIIDRVAGETLDEGELFHSKGWSIKLMESFDEPTEEEWSKVFINTDLSISDIGSESSANTDSRKIIWIRLFCPGNTDPEIIESLLTLKYNTMLVMQEEV